MAKASKLTAEQRVATIIEWLADGYLGQEDREHKWIDKEGKEHSTTLSFARFADREVVIERARKEFGIQRRQAETYYYRASKQLMGALKENTEESAGAIIARLIRISSKAEHAEKFSAASAAAIAAAKMIGVQGREEIDLNAKVDASVKNDDLPSDRAGLVDLLAARGIRVVTDDDSDDED